MTDADGNDLTGYRMAGRIPLNRRADIGFSFSDWEDKPIETLVVQVLVENRDTEIDAAASTSKLNSES